MARQVTILDTLADPKLFKPFFEGSEAWERWTAALAAGFGLPMTPAQLAIYRECTGRTTAPTQQARQLWLCVGRRGGKSRLSALIAVYFACFRSYASILAPGEFARIPIIAENKDQAGVVFGYVKAMFDQIPMLNALKEHERADGFILKNRVIIQIHAASFRGTRGYTIPAAIFDEVAFWQNADKSANPDSEILKAIRPGMLTVPNAMLVGISSPHARRGILWEAYAKHYGKDDDPVLVWQAPTRTMNPTVPQDEIDLAYEEDPAAAAAEYGAEFRRDLESYVSKEVLAGATVPGRTELPPLSDTAYYAFCDPSGGSQDSMTLAIAHQEGGVAVLDCLSEAPAPFSPETVVAEFAEIIKSYGLAGVKGDRYGGEWPAERFAKCGIGYEPSDLPKSDIYKAFLPLLNSGRAQLLDHRRMQGQLLSLERRATASGKDVIDHPRNLKDDLANAAAGALVDAGRVAEHYIGATNLAGDVRARVDAREVDAARWSR